MKKARVKLWHRLWAIIPALILIFPLGLVLLWTSPRDVKTKVLSTALFLAVGIGAVAGAVTTGLYDELVGSRETIGLYDTSLDGRGRYNTPEILPYEREIFSAVVREKRRMSSRLPPADEDLSIETIVPETKAFQTVADDKQIPVKDVEAIYLKVSHQISGKAR